MHDTFGELQHLPPAPDAVRHRITTATATDLRAALNAMGLEAQDVDAIIASLGDLRASEEAVTTLAAIVHATLAAHDDESVPLPGYYVDPQCCDLHRLLPLVALAICHDDDEAHLAQRGVPDSVIAATSRSTALQVTLHKQFHGSLGVLSGWWQLYGQRGGFLEIGGLHYHRIILGESPLGPDRWLSELEQERFGPGYRVGDEAVAMHIPHGADLSDEAVTAAMEEAGSVVRRFWPSEGRRIVSLQTWMLDRQLRSYLAPGSRILQFQEHFTPTGLHRHDTPLTMQLLFGARTADLDAVAQPTTLQRAIIDLVRTGRHSHWEIGTRILIDGKTRGHE